MSESPEARCVALVRRMAGLDASCPVSEWIVRTHVIATEARAIVADLPPEVDPLLIEAREVCAKFSERLGHNFDAKRFREGALDENYMIEPVLAALRRGIELGAEQ